MTHCGREEWLASAGVKAMSHGRPTAGLDAGSVRFMRALNVVSILNSPGAQHAVVDVNFGLIDAFEARTALRLSPPVRRPRPRRRRTLADLVAAGANAPP